MKLRSPQSMKNDTLRIDAGLRSVDSWCCEPAHQSDPGHCHAPLIVATRASGRARRADYSVQGVLPSSSISFAKEQLLVGNFRIPPLLTHCLTVARL